jgi:tyrosine-protein phosphatase SIW14
MRHLALFLIFLLTVSAGELRVRPIEWAQPIIGSSLDNFYKVSEGVYRSQQPESKDFDNIVSVGIGEVLSLREYHSDNDEAEKHKMTLHRIKVDTGKMNEEQLKEALKIIIDRKSPILVHCWHGSDRTGAVIASYRVVVEGWTKEQAIDELQNGNFGYHATIYPNIVKLIKSLDVEQMRKSLGLKSKGTKTKA